MSEPQTRCPNCGGAFRAQPAVRQRAGSRTVVLRWLLCTRCGHVALSDWRFLDSNIQIAHEQHHEPRRAT